MLRGMFIHSRGFQTVLGGVPVLLGADGVLMEDSRRGGGEDTPESWLAFTRVEEHWVCSSLWPMGHAN